MCLFDKLFLFLVVLTPNVYIAIVGAVYTKVKVTCVRRLVRSETNKLYFLLLVLKAREDDTGE